MHLPAVPALPAGSLSNSELLRMFGAWGHCSKVAIRRALSMLPEIVGRGLYRRTATTPHEFAYKKLGVTKEVVDRILYLHGQIGHMPELWGLLTRGDEGWSKLEIVATVATPGSAAGWSKLVKKCSRTELKDLVKRYKLQSGDQRGVEPTRPLLEGLGKQARAPTAPLGSSPESKDIGDSTSSQGVSGQDVSRESANGQGAYGQTVSMHSAGSNESAGSNSSSSSGNSETVSMHSGPAGCLNFRSASATEGDRSLAASIEFAPIDSVLIESVPNDVSLDLGTLLEVGRAEGSTRGAVGAGQGVLPEVPGSRQNGPRRLTIELTPGDEDLLRAWQAQMQRSSGKAVSLGEVVGRLLRGELPHASRFADGTTAIEPGVRSLDEDGIAHAKAADAAREGKAPAQAGHADRDGAAEAHARHLDCDGAAEAHAGHSAYKGAPPARAADAGPKGTAPARADSVFDLARAMRPKVVEVVLRATGLGYEAVGRLIGVLPAGVAAAFQASSTIDLQDLYLEAIAAAGRRRGDRIPFPVCKYVALRAAFRCETGGCDSPMHGLDHDLPRAEGGDHHPDHIHARCRLHHGMRHKALFADLAAGVVVEPGDPDLSSPADRAFQAARSKAVATSP